MPAFITYIDSPLGVLEISGTDAHLQSVLFARAEHKPAPGQPASEGEIPAAVAQTIRQLNEYFAGTRRDFDLPIQPQGTHIQQHIWNL